MSYILDEYGNLINERDESPAVFNSVRSIPRKNNNDRIFRASNNSSIGTINRMGQRGAAAVFTVARHPRHAAQVSPHMDEEHEILMRKISEGYENLAAWKRAGDATIAAWERDVLEKIAAFKLAWQPRSEFPTLPRVPSFPAFPTMPVLPAATKKCNALTWNEKKRTTVYTWKKNRERILTSWKDNIAKTKSRYESERRSV